MQAPQRELAQMSAPVPPVLSRVAACFVAIFVTAGMGGTSTMPYKPRT